VTVPHGPKLVGKKRKALVTALAEPAPPEAAAAKPFAGFRAKLNFDHGGIAVTTDVRYMRMTDKDIAEKLKIVIRSPTGGLVEHRKIGEYHFAYIEVDTGKEIPASQVRYFQVMPDGSETEVTPFEKTKELTIHKLLDREQLENYLPDSFYEVWGPMPSQLWKIAEYLENNDKVGVCRFVASKGFKDYYGIIYPVKKEDGSFILCCVA